MARRRGLYDVVQLKLRLEEYIRRRLEHSAKKNSRSLNSEIVHRLRQSLRDAEDDTDATAKAVMDSLDSKVLDRIIEMVNQERATDIDWEAAEEAHREEIELRAKELLAEREKEKDSK
jgi:hypothetical protein